MAPNSGGSRRLSAVKGLHLQRLFNSCACASVRSKAHFAPNLRKYRVGLSTCALFAGGENHILRKRGQNKTSVSLNCSLVLFVAVSVFPIKVSITKDSGIASNLK